MDDLFQRYPRLADGHFARTSPATDTYNCVAWAAGQNTHWWDPLGFWWPRDGLPEWSIRSLSGIYEQIGYQPDESPALEAGVEKIAIYGFGEDPKHVARQLETGAWTSKMGRSVDIEHDLDGLTGAKYGEVLLIMSRPRSTSPEPPLPLVRLSFEDVVGV